MARNELQRERKLGTFDPIRNLSCSWKPWLKTWNTSTQFDGKQKKSSDQQKISIKQLLRTQKNSHENDEISSTCYCYLH